MGVDFHDIVIWIELIRDKATMDGITPQEAVTKIVEELKLYTQFTTLQQAIKHAQQNLEVINIAIEQRRQAIASLVDLNSKGISDTEIIELNSLISSRNGGGWNRLNLRLDDKLNLASPIGKNNLEQPSNGNNSYDDGNLSMSDLIRLNLKSNTTRQLNRMVTPSSS